MFGFAGAHRSGKTTLAKNVSELSGIPYINASVTDLMKKAGYDGVSNLSIDKRIDAQEQLLTFYLEVIDKAPKPFITDRTPYDMVGYTLGELTMHNSSKEIGERYAQYLGRCLRETQNNFSQLFVTRPLVSYAADPTKPPENLGYQMMVQLLIEGTAVMGNAPSQILLMEDHNTRVETVMRKIQKLLEEVRDVQRTLN